MADHDPKHPRTAAFLVIGLCLSALANVLDLPPWLRLTTGLAAVAIIFWVFVRYIQSKDDR